MENEKRIKTEVTASMVKTSFDRRDFLKTVGGGIVVFFGTDFIPAAFGQEGIGRGYPSDLNAYLRIGADGRVTVYSGKIEMGQGVVTSLAQMAADELGVALESINMVLGDTDLCPYDAGTYGSTSTRMFGPALRGAAAEAKAILLELASERLKTPKEKLTAENGIIYVTSNKQSKVAYAQLALGQKITRKLEGKAVLKTVNQFAIMGKSVKRLDVHDKVTGKAKYAGDLRETDMLYASVLRPPAHGATLKSADTSMAEGMPGVIVVKESDLIATLHKDPEQATKALQSIKAQFAIPKPAIDTDSVFDYLIKSAGQGQESEKKGDLVQGEKVSANLFEGRYENGYGAHAPIETHTALAKIENGKATVWTSTQIPFPNKQEVAKGIGFAPENVRIITPYVGGGFGGKAGTSGRQAVQAAKLAKITGKTVQVMWSRADEFYYDTFRPAAVVKIKSGIDKAGKICLWDYSVYYAGSRSAEQFYDVPNNLMRVYGGWYGGGGDGKPHLFGVGPWRAPGANINVFARESQVDIMAAHAKVDPLEFRLNNTSDQRMRNVLESAAQHFGYKKAVCPSGRGIGIACTIDAETYVAQIVEITVDKSTGKVKVKRVVCAQDMGTVINPEGAIMQAEGCITMGLGYSLTEELTFSGGEILVNNFDNYDIPRFSWLPQIEVYLIKNDELPPKGGGEPAITPIGAAIANAIFDATGARLLRMPMTPQRVLDAMAKA
jgi:nicotinate dehydrogenase subunit B